MPDPGVPAEIDFRCRVCGIKCDLAPDPPARAVCPEHCEHHEFVYVREERGHFCDHCGMPAPFRQVIEDRLKQLVAEGKLMTLSDEECAMLAEFRRFKATAKPGAVFKWQTRPDQTLIVEPPEVALISHPQNVSG
jgi:hypothetical protein